MLFNVMSKDMLLSYFLVVMLLSYSNKNRNYNLSHNLGRVLELHVACYKGHVWEIT